MLLGPFNIAEILFRADEPNKSLTLKLGLQDMGVQTLFTEYAIYMLVSLQGFIYLYLSLNMLGCK